jgi:hypothetical protein
MNSLPLNVDPAGLALLVFPSLGPPAAQVKPLAARRW